MGELTPTEEDLAKVRTQVARIRNAIEGLEFRQKELEWRLEFWLQLEEEMFGG